MTFAVEDLPIDSVKPYEKNPRKNEHAIDAVANSIKAFGFRQPIVVDANAVIIIGHTRWMAAQKLGLKRVAELMRQKGHSGALTKPRLKPKINETIFDCPGRSGIDMRADNSQQ